MVNGPRPPSLLETAELRIAGALAVAALALLFAVLAVVARRTDELLLDLRGFTPSTSRPGLTGAALAAHFQAVQSVAAEQQPFRLTLQLDPPAGPGDFFAAERELPVQDEDSCFRVFLVRPAYVPGSDEGLRAVNASVSVNGKTAATLPLVDLDQAYPVAVEGLPEGKARVRFELRATAAHPGPPGPAPWVVHFELATLKGCG